MDHLFFVLLQNPALLDAPISLEIDVTAAPKSSIQTLGATVAVHAGVRVLLLPAGKSPVQLSSMTMVWISPYIHEYKNKKRAFILLTMERIPCPIEKQLYWEMQFTGGNSSW